MTCGSVDDGKSTLIGHLLFQTGNVFDDHYRTLVEESKRIGNAGDRIDFSLLLDGLTAEREQGITIDVAYRYFSWKTRDFIVADTPGHEEYTRNMATAASNCSAAIILIDARLGVLNQTRRHCLICSLCGISQIAFAVNKMDAIGWSFERYKEIQSQCASIIQATNRFGPAPSWRAVPVSALLGDNLSESSTNMPWYDGLTILEWLEVVPGDKDRSSDPFRFAVQYVIKPGISRDRWQETALKEFNPEESANYRGYAGRVMSGRVGRGDTVMVLPSGLSSRVTGIRGEGGTIECATAGMSISLTLADMIDVSRGDALTHPDSRFESSDQFRAIVVWMQSAQLIAGRSYNFRNVYGQAVARVMRIVDRIDPETYLPLAAEHLDVNGIGEVELALNHPTPFDPYGSNKWSGSFLLVDRKTNATAACGIIQHGLRRAENVQWQEFSVDQAARSRIKEQRACVVWFTGLSGAGKSRIADLVERKLHSLGRHTMLLDGDNVRHGLSKDLGFTEQDRVENIRRIGEVSKLMTQAGLIVLACFISPYQSDRDSVRALFEKGDFHEIFVDAPVHVCESRDPKGLYKKARAGLIPNFTGVNAPYQPPVSPELHVNTAEMTLEACVDAVMTYLADKGIA
jgi:bifunctional enzyme CysN/CysC